jgi:hypothetical protein
LAGQGKAASGTGLPPVRGREWLSGGRIVVLKRFRSRRRSTNVAVVAGMLVVGLVASGCRAQPAAPTSTGPETFAPTQTFSVRKFGAVGNGRADDTAALARALSASDGKCLDGEGRAYRVVGTLRVTHDLCLRNITLTQSQVPFDTRGYIRNSCPIVADASAIVDCGDPPVRPEDLKALNDSLSVRTLFIRPDKGNSPLRVLLDGVKVDTGRYPEAGSRTDSAGIWIESADGATLRNVEVTGYGKGHPLIVLRSRNVTVDGLWVHDVVWSPYAGDSPLSRQRVSEIGWNKYPIHEFRRVGEQGAKVAKFYGVRVQEQVTCAAFSEVRDVVIRNARISRCMARFADGDLPWQADGLDISRSSSNVLVQAPVIDMTWEGMDIAANGTGIDGLQIRDARVSNCFSFCLKLGKQLRNPIVTNATIANAGIAGIVFYGPVQNGDLNGASITGIGMISVGGIVFSPWPAQASSGVRIDDGASGDDSNARSTPRGLNIDNVQVSGAPGGPAYAFAVLNKGGRDVRVQRLRASGFSRAAIGGESGNGPNLRSRNDAVERVRPN